MLRDGGVVQLPSANHLRNLEAASPGKTGQDIDLYRRVGKDLEVLPAKKRELNVVFDEVNTVGNVAFKLIKGKYRFFGIVDKPNPDRIFAPPPKKALTVEQRCQRLMASHALVFMAVVIFDTYQPDPAKPHFSPERVFRRVVGIHAVRDAVAEDIDELFWDTVANLKLYAGARVISATCDGAGANRLFQKYNASYQGRGTPNTFVTASVRNDIEDDPTAVIYLISDSSHLIKKMCTRAPSPPRAFGP